MIRTEDRRRLRTVLALAALTGPLAACAAGRPYSIAMASPGSVQTLFVVGDVDDGSASAIGQVARGPRSVGPGSALVVASLPNATTTQAGSTRQVSSARATAVSASNVASLADPVTALGHRRGLRRPSVAPQTALAAATPSTLAALVQPVLVTPAVSTSASVATGSSAALSVAVATTVSAPVASTSAVVTASVTPSAVAVTTAAATPVIASTVSVAAAPSSGIAVAAAAPTPVVAPKVSVAVAPATSAPLAAVAVLATPSAGVNVQATLVGVQTAVSLAAPTPGAPSTTAVANALHKATAKKGH